MKGGDVQDEEEIKDVVKDSKDAMKQFNYDENRLSGEKGDLMLSVVKMNFECKC